jgi:hypothetical protein
MSDYLTPIRTKPGVVEEALSAFHNYFKDAPGDRVTYILIFPVAVCAVREKGSFESRMNFLCTAAPVAGRIICEVTPN